LQRSLPQGEGIGYEFTASRVQGDAPDALLGRAFVQANADRLAVGAEYARASRVEGGQGGSRAFLAGSVGYVGGSFFVSRPVQDSFALIRIPEMPQVPVYANGWYVGKTDAAGEVVATNLASYYDNFVAFGTQNLAFDYVFETAEKVISPLSRSGSLVTFEVKKNRAVYGILLHAADSKPVPLEFRELRLIRGNATIRSFTARRGEFYFDGVEPGSYDLRLDGEPSCTAVLTVPANVSGMTDVGQVRCQ
jgi:outer membrane usher protein